MENLKKTVQMSKVLGKWQSMQEIDAKYKAYRSNMKLTDLSADCLNKLFNYLNFKDMKALAVANLTDCDDLERAFFKETNAKIYPYEAAIRDWFMKYEYNENDAITNNPDYFELNNAFLRLFRSLIANIWLCYDTKYHRHNAKMEQIIIKYGATYLNEIIFINADMSAFEDIEKPFVHVKTLKFEDGYLSKTFCDLGKWFPRLESLTLNQTQIFDPTFIEHPFPYLKNLSVKNKHIFRHDHLNRTSVDDDFLNYFLSNKNLKKFIELNARLENLVLFHDRTEGFFKKGLRSDEFLIQINSELLKAIATNLPRLHYLELDIKEIGLDFAKELINFNLNLKTLVVETLRVSQLTQLNIMSDKLVNLNLTIHLRSRNYDVLSQFVERFANIEYLTITWSIDIFNQDFIKMIKKSTTLKHLQIELDKNIFANHLSHVVSQFDHLKTLTVKCVDIPMRDRQSFLDVINKNDYLQRNNWNCSLSPISHFLFRKRVIYAQM